MTDSPQLLPITPRGRRAVGLSARQQEVLDLVADGLGNKQIAHRLGISEQGVKQQVSVLLRKLGVASRAALVRTYFDRRLLGSLGPGELPYEHLFVSAPILIAMTQGPDDRFAFVNRAFVAFFGDRKYLGQTLETYIPEARRLLTSVRVSCATGEGLRDRARHLVLRLPDAALRQAELSMVVAPLRDAAAAGLGALLCAWELSDPPQASRTHVATPSYRSAPPPPPASAGGSRGPTRLSAPL